MRITRTSLLHEKIYSDDTLDWDVLGFNIGFQYAQWLICPYPLKAKGDYMAVDNCERPRCAACDFGKFRHQLDTVKTIKKNNMKDKYLKKDHLQPGNMMSAVHHISQVPGTLYHTTYKSDPYEMFSGGCVFIDHASGHMSIKHQVAINATENIKSKITLEREYQSQEVPIKGYHTGNGIFNASEFLEELFGEQKKIRFTGAGTSYQNGTAERIIKTLVTMTRTILMHSALRSTEDTFSTDLWRIEMDYDVWIYNWIPYTHYGSYAIDIWTNSRFEPVSETLSN